MGWVEYYDDGYINRLTKVVFRTCSEKGFESIWICFNSENGHFKLNVTLNLIMKYSFAPFFMQSK